MISFCMGKGKILITISKNNKSHCLINTYLVPVTILSSFYVSSFFRSRYLKFSITVMQKFKK